MQSQNPTSFIAAEAITAGARVKLNADLTVSNAGAADREIGIAVLFGAKSSYALGDGVSVWLFFPSRICIAAGAFAQGATVQRMALGKVDDTGSGVPFGIAAEAALADGDLVEVFPLRGPGTLAIPADIATADATDLASAEALANANKAKLNALLDALR